MESTQVTQLKVLPGKVLVDILTKTPSFNLHHRQIKRYGCWLLLKASLIRHVRERAARDGPQLATMVNRLLGKSFDPSRQAQRLSAVGQRGPRATSPPVYVRSSVGTVPSLAQAARAHGPDRGSAPRGAEPRSGPCARAACASDGTVPTDDRT